METKKFCPFSEEEIKAVLKARMNEHRFEHSLNVAERAAFLAEKYGADTEEVICDIDSYIAHFLISPYFSYSAKSFMQSFQASTGFSALVIGRPTTMKFEPSSLALAAAFFS